MSGWRELQEQALEKVELAGAYLENGAPRSPARCLRGAADKLDLAAKLRDASMVSVMKATS